MHLGQANSRALRATGANCMPSKDVPREVLSGGVTTTPLVPHLVLQAPAMVDVGTKTLSITINTCNANESSDKQV